MQFQVIREAFQLLLNKWQVNPIADVKEAFYNSNIQKEDVKNWKERLNDKDLILCGKKPKMMTILTNTSNSHS